jgi:hypothetical protein
MLAEIEAIAKWRPVDCVYALVRDSEDLAMLSDGRLPLVIINEAMTASELANLLPDAVHDAGGTMRT